MSNKLPGGKVIDLSQAEQQRKQIELQKQSFIATTRLRLAENHLNTLLGRLDMDLSAPETMPGIVQMALDYADALLLSMGIITKTDAN